MFTVVLVSFRLRSVALLLLMVFGLFLQFCCSCKLSFEVLFPLVPVVCCLHFCYSQCLLWAPVSSTELYNTSVRVHSKSVKCFVIIDRKLPFLILKNNFRN